MEIKLSPNLLAAIHEAYAPRANVDDATEVIPEPDIFTPRNFDEYVGQESAKEIAKIIVQAAKQERRALPHTMISGEFGLGKTALAKLMLQEYDLPVRIFDGSGINREIPKGTYIIDEIHNVNAETADTLNILMDRGDVHIIGATTNPGLLSSAFRSRFRGVYLEPYDPRTLEEILRNICERRGTKHAKDTLYEIARRSRSNARTAIQYLSFVFDLLAISSNAGIKRITGHIVQDAFNKLGVDKDGFIKSRDYKYLAALPDDRPVGLQYLAAVTGIDEQTIAEEVEPFLMRMGFVDRTQKGRIKIKEVPYE